MAHNNAKKSLRKPFPLIPVVAILLSFGVLLTAGGFTFAASQEQKDAFCASCHTQPESTFYERSTAGQAVDLASAHTAEDTRCIDCHSGPGVSGRISAEMMGAHNALAWFSKTAVQPAVLTKPIADANCLKCHAEVTTRRGGDNHFHAFLARWQSRDANAGTCTSCHSSHTTDGDAQQYLNRARTEAVCQDCHTALGEGGE